LRLLRLDLLRTVPFLYNGANQSFDLDLAIQLACSGQQIETIALAPCEPLRRWPGKLALTSLLRSAAQFRLMQYELFYDPKFDVAPSRYLTKEARTSIHHFLRNIPLAPGSEVLDVGGGNGEATGLAHARRGVRVTSIDQVAPPVNSPVQFHRVDLDQPWLAQFPYRSYDTIFALDVLEHLKTPETGLREIFRLLRRQGTLYASTANVAFFPLRLMLLSGQFNYGRRGILDLTHRRLFTIGSFKRILRNSGFSVEKVYGFGPPILDLSRNPGVLTRLADSLFAFLARVWPAMFAFQFVAVCKRMDSPSELLPEIRVES
jgi:SAM-dependent methyltransferase